LYPAIRISSRTGLIFGEGVALLPVVTACGLALLLVAYCATPAPTRAPGGQEPELPALLKAEPVKVDPKDDELRKLLKERYNEALAEIDERSRRVLGILETPDTLLGAAERFVRAGLELSGKPADQVALLEKYVEFAKAVEQAVDVRIKAGVRNFTKGDLHQAKYARADAEVQLLRAKEKAKADKK
jgi:hypothetical protein